MTRILVWFWSGGGGGSQFAVRLAHRLSLQFSADNVALSMRADDPTIARAEHHGLRVLPAAIVSARRRPLTTIAQLGEGARVIACQAADFDVVIVAMNFAMAAPLIGHVKKPLVYCAHDPTPHPGDYAQVAQRLTQARLLRRADKVVALSHYAAKLLAPRVTPDRLAVAPLSSVFEPQPVAPLASQGPVRLLMGGRMLAYKGLDILADALVPLRARDDWRLSIIGAGPALTDTMGRFRIPQVTRIENGAVSAADWEAALSAADVVLAPYRSASQSGVIAEALARGKPCVVTPVGALSEQIGDGAAGWIADAPSARGFAKALVRVLDNAVERPAKATGAQRIAESAWNSDYWGWLGSLAR